MKKRLLFVDDEPMVLQGIQRLLRPLRMEWEMEFAEGGAAAQTALLASPFDVVITDMMMPEIDGAAVLDFARENSPATIRLVLSGHAEQEHAMKCVGLAHQYLSKPCDAETLRKTIARVTELGFARRNERVMTLVARLKHLPSIPDIYAQIVRLLDDPDTSMEEVGAVIAGDMAMTAKILQLVNSSFFGLARSVSQPAEAVSYLGLDTLKALVLATGVFGQFETRMPYGFSAAVTASHSQRVGTAARTIAQCEQAPRAVADQALLAGLLHDVGKLVLASNLPEEYERLPDFSHLDPLEAERQVFGTTHSEVGGYLLGLWGLPPAVVEAIQLHHSPAESGATEFSALTAVHVADGLFYRRTNSMDLGWIASLGLADRLPAWREAVNKIPASTTLANQPNPRMNHRILFVDDDANLLEAIQRGLRKQFTIETAVGGGEALRKLENDGPYAVIVADMQMPEMSGLDFLRQAQNAAPDSVRMMLTGNSDLKTAVDAVNDGRVFRFLTKPCPPPILAPALDAGLEHFRLKQAERDLLENTLGGAVKILTEVLAMADPASFERSARLKQYVHDFTQTSNVGTPWELELAAMLCQIGRVTVPPGVLEKVREGLTLTGPEQGILDQVPAFGARLLENIPRLENVANIVRYQQKHFDGSGLPAASMAGTDIPIGARILKVLSDLVDFEFQNVSRSAAFQKMQEHIGWYDLQVLSAVSRWCDVSLAVPPKTTLSNPTALRIDAIQPGHLLAQDLRTRDGLLIMAANTELTPMLLAKLLNFGTLNTIEHTLLVYIPEAAA